jgi:membrane peptidoglycan carboxypeptidase
MLKKFKKFLPKKDAGFFKKMFFWILTGIISLCFLMLVIVAAAIAIFSISLPDVDDINAMNLAQSTEIYDRNNELIHTFHGEENRERVALKNISKNVINATIALEDDEFYEHGGFDFLAILKAVGHNVFGIGTARGGSTITQQYVKNGLLSAERSYTRKAKELILSMRLESSKTKDEILELYLNQIPYGNNAYGIQKAAKIYFGKNASDLTIAESAVLAALPQAPSRYNPYSDKKYSHLIETFTTEELEKRTFEDETDLEIDEYVRGLIGRHVNVGDGRIIYIPGRTDIAIRSMHQLSMITAEERQEALDELQTLEFNTYRGSTDKLHFILYIKQILEQKYGKEIVEQGGLKVYTSLDSELQDLAEEVSAERGEFNEANYGTSNNAVLSVNAKTGEILAMVGSRDYFNEEIDGNINMTMWPRQPGSSFKPFVYAQAFYKGYAPGNVIYDVPMRLGSKKPSNYDGSWSGKVTIRRALSRSMNIPAIKAYFLAGEQKPIINLVEKLGITTLDENHDYGYPLALGAGSRGVPLSEMVTAYATFANNGRKPELTAILKVENANGDILEEWDPEPFEEVLDPQVAYLINDILSDQASSVGPRLFVNGHVNAAKTGTSTKENKQESGGAVRPADAWTIGYTPTIVTGVWTGNTNGTGLGYNANGYDTAGPIYQAVMAKALEGMSAEPFPQPKGIQEIAISKVSGKLPVYTPSEEVYTEKFSSFSVPEAEDQVLIEVEIDKISGLLATEFTPPEARQTVRYQKYQAIANLFNWQTEVDTFFATRSEEETGETQNSSIKIGVPPTDFSTVHSAQTEALAPQIIITSPGPQSDIETGIANIDVDIDAPHGVKTVEFYLNGDRKFATDTAPYNGFVNISRFLEPGERQLISARIVDNLGYVSESAIEVRIADPEEEEDQDIINLLTGNNDDDDE